MEEVNNNECPVSQKRSLYQRTGNTYLGLVDFVGVKVITTNKYETPFTLQCLMSFWSPSMHLPQNLYPLA